MKVEFNPEKITDAIFKASCACGQGDWNKAKILSDEVVKKLNQGLKKNSIPTVEEVQDVVEKTLIENGLAKVAKEYILYRKHRAEIRREKGQILNKEEIDGVDKKFDVNALRVLAARYLRKDDDGRIIESPKELFRRVAIHTAIPSIFYDSKIFQKKPILPKNKNSKTEIFA